MLASVWINTDKFDSAGLLWNGLGCACWVLCYAVLMTRILRKKFVEMPFFIAAGNLAWEFVWSVCYHPDTGRLFSWAYQCAFGIDIFIFCYLFVYGYKQVKEELFQQYFKWILIFSLALWLPLNYFFVKQGLDTSIGATSGYILNVFISLLCPLLYLRNEAHYFSKWVAWSRFLGTGFISVSMFLFYPENHLVHTLAVLCGFVDFAFILLLHGYFSLPSKASNQHVRVALEEENAHPVMEPAELDN